MTHLPGRGSREKDVLVRFQGTAHRLPVVLPCSSGGRTAILCGWWSFKKFIIIIFSPHLRTFSHCFWERGRGGERETERQRNRETVRHTLIVCLSHTPQLGIEPTTWAGALARNPACNLPLLGWRSNQLSHTDWPGLWFMISYTRFSGICSSGPVEESLLNCDRPRQTDRQSGKMFFLICSEILELRTVIYAGVV